MPVLVIEKAKESRGLVLQQSAVLGRVSGLDVILHEEGVSRIHALVAEEEGQWFVEDLGSRNGTFVNHDPVKHRHPLMPGDLIHIGRATLSFRQIEQLPEGIQRIASRDPAIRDIVFRCPHCAAVLRAKPMRIGSAGRCLSCQAKLIIPARSATVAEPCGGTLEKAQVPRDANASAQTSVMNESVKESDQTVAGVTLRETSPKMPPSTRPEIPESRPDTVASETPAMAMDSSESEVLATTVASPASAETPDSASFKAMTGHGSDMIEWVDDDDDAQVLDPQLPTSVGVCSVCQTQVLSNMASQSCDECHSVYHEECWYAMEGCSTYGCRQVGSLKEKKPVAVKPMPSKARRRRRRAIVQRDDRVPWDWMFVAAAMLGLFVGPFTAGIPNALLLLTMMGFLVVCRDRRVSAIAVLLGAVLCLGGMVGGFYGFQYLSELGWVHLGGILK